MRSDRRKELAARNGDHWAHHDPAIRELINQAWDEGYSKGNLDGYFGVSDEWKKRHPEARP